MNIKSKLSKLKKKQVIKLVALALIGGFFFLVSQGIKQKKRKKEKSVHETVLEKIKEEKKAQKQPVQIPDDPQSKDLLAKYAKLRKEKEYKKTQDKIQHQKFNKEKERIRFSSHGYDRNNGEKKTPPQTKSPKTHPQTSKGGYGGYASRSKSLSFENTKTQPRSLIPPKKVKSATSSNTFGSTSSSSISLAKKNTRTGLKTTNIIAEIDGEQLRSDKTLVKILIKEGVFKGSKVKPNQLAWGRLSINNNRAIIILNEVKTINGLKRGLIRNIGRDGLPGLYLSSNPVSKSFNKGVKNKITEKIGSVASSITNGVASDVADVVGSVAKGSRSNKARVRLFDGTHLIFR